MNPYGTHQKLLFKAIEMTKLDVIEFGVGDYSTPQLHELCKDRTLFTVEDNEEWLAKFIHLENEAHKFMREYNGSQFYGVIFNDGGTYEGRIEIMRNYRMKCEFMVIHDSEIMIDFAAVGLDIESIKDWREYFRYYAEFQDNDGGPCTLIGSNFIDVSALEVEGMQRIYR